jgi:hypothetical protein
VHLAQKAGRPVNVAIINNDLQITPGTIEVLAETMRKDARIWITYPDYDKPAGTEPHVEGVRFTSGTYRHGGMSGFIFMLRGEMMTWQPLVDERFQWWGGDDDIAFTVEQQGGRQARVVGLGVTHLMEGTARHHDLGAKKQADLAAVIEKWGR